MARSLNKVQLIGNLTRDPELRYTPQGTAVCSFGLATNRQWKTEDGQTHDEAEFHRIVAWNQLAEICSKLLHKGNRTYVEGRLQTRDWTGQDGQKRTTVEIIASEMILLSSREAFEDIPEDLGEEPPLGEAGQAAPKRGKKKSPASKGKGGGGSKTKSKKKETPIEEDDIPF